MNKELKDYIDGIVAPSIIIAKRIYTGEKVRELCENIERAVKEVYGKSALRCYAGKTADRDQIYYFSCIKKYTNDRWIFRMCLSSHGG